ncbi:AraC family transcriptional regulator [Pseudomonas sp. M47T1]|uniref:GlxA family transcriptional regulator n=1 Tax=unclassified Pseudomonas TaxID=196821 RepID=UPI0002608995|nr:helix-turn-helix domain-containing protein [Pseudomonas sp. M47T1]EIK95822.1 AraC family transcriptional regulator [Pseudomonas sp. M47T1]
MIFLHTATLNPTPTPSAPVLDSTPGAVRDIAILSYPGCYVGDVIKLLETLHALDLRPCCSLRRGASLQARVYSLDGAPLRSPAMPWVSVQTHPLDPPGPDAPDTLIIAHGPAQALDTAATPLLRWLQAVQPRARRVVALGAGVFWLAAAHLLDGRQVTTHSALRTLLALRFPALAVQSGGSVQIDGPFYTTNERMSASDMALLLLRDHCAAVRGLPCPPLATSPQPPSPDGPALRLCRWWLQRLDHPLNVAQAAAYLHTSERNLRRQLRQDCGCSPHGLLVLLRLDMARQALLDSDLPVDKIGRRGGFGDGQQLARSFRKYLGLAPGEYRRTRTPARLHADYARLFDGIAQPGWLLQLRHAERVTQ